MLKNKKVILISGTSSGIGKYLAYKLSNKYIVVGFSRKGSKLKRSNYFDYKLDINNYKNMRKIVNKIILKFKQIDILINNAGTNISSGNLFFVKKDFIEKTIKTNLTSTTLLTQEIIRHMILNNSGKVINIGSSVSNLLPQGESIYAASKAGLIVFSKILSKELKKFNITSNSISPFIVNTPIIKKIDKKKISKILKENNKKKNKLIDIYNAVKKIINNNINGKNLKI